VAVQPIGHGAQALDQVGVGVTGEVHVVDQRRPVVGRLDVGGQLDRQADRP
jgi:hypothetical protein